MGQRGSKGPRGSVGQLKPHESMMDPGERGGGRERRRSFEEMDYVDTHIVRASERLLAEGVQLKPPDFKLWLHRKLKTELGVNDTPSRQTFLLALERARGCISENGRVIESQAQTVTVLKQELEQIETMMAKLLTLASTAVDGEGGSPVGLNGGAFATGERHSALNSQLELEEPVEAVLEAQDGVEAHREERALSVLLAEGCEKSGLKVSGKRLHRVNTPVGKVRGREKEKGVSRRSRGPPPGASQGFPREGISSSSKYDRSRRQSLFPSVSPGKPNCSIREKSRSSSQSSSAGWRTPVEDMQSDEEDERVEGVEEEEEEEEEETTRGTQHRPPSQSPSSSSDSLLSDSAHMFPFLCLPTPSTASLREGKCHPVDNEEGSPQMKGSDSVRALKRDSNSSVVVIAPEALSSHSSISSEESSPTPEISSPSHSPSASLGRPFPFQTPNPPNPSAEAGIDAHNQYKGPKASHHPTHPHVLLGTLPQGARLVRKTQMQKKEDAGPSPLRLKRGPRHSQVNPQRGTAGDIPQTHSLPPPLPPLCLSLESHAEPTIFTPLPQEESGRDTNTRRLPVLHHQNLSQHRNQQEAEGRARDALTSRKGQGVTFLERSVIVPLPPPPGLQERAGRLPFFFEHS
uniref:Uncharacterized protein n=1 Tax=Chromera velia CCMP2878 TaxID=1169474 RepID=A0A0G4HWY3_9ALVE|eukprot:Cvel_1465.t1-p1 / transcript=Cvel_1465.t1 / gene=Cvel_1465 / organism=Chromera_velia_CCMP2878 / gene_product=hypothetical protein / transcript_product=hypothetical protein / location=Cvel_scaffold51:104063-107463(-) / protein_length=631 / sequence_SO=supercontig / SO=protein_coding / is_pseudo=false